MSTAPSARGYGLISCVAVLGSAWVDLAIQEAYFRISSSSVGLVVLTTAALLIACAASVIRVVADGLLADVLQRMLFLVAVLISGYWMLGGTLAGLWDGGGRQAAVVAMLMGVFAVFALLLLRANAALWDRARLAMVVSMVLFVVSGPMLGWLRAKDLTWPIGFQTQDAATDAGRVATIVLLLDELNARNSDSIIDELKNVGLTVNFKAVPSVGDGTAKVVPALFTGIPFFEPRPCGLTTICSANEALDFGRIEASRPDIDIVGFYHPYCAIKGLRSCSRQAAGLAMFDSRRWQCGLWRRFGLSMGVNEEECRKSSGGVWRTMSDRLLNDLRKAKTLASGGLLYAHLPLPHPPGNSTDGTLAQHYDANLKRSADIVGEILQIANHSGLELRVIIFSDHPLRQQAWCKGYPGFFTGSCVPISRLVDDEIPLIVAGATVPSLYEFTSNLKVFSLASWWARK